MNIEDEGGLWSVQPRPEVGLVMVTINATNGDDHVRLVLGLKPPEAHRMIELLQRHTATVERAQESR